MSTHRHVYLTPEQRAQLDRLTRTGTASAQTHTRARILLLIDRSQPDRCTDAAVASGLRCHTNTVGNVRRRFVQQGLDAALYDQPRPGAPPKITGEVEAQLTLLACSTPPDGRKHWTLQLLADKLVELGVVDSISDVAVMQRLKKIASSRGA